MDLITVIRKDNLAFDFRISVVVDGLSLIDLRLGEETLKTFYTTSVRDPEVVSGAVVAIQINIFV